MMRQPIIEAPFRQIVYLREWNVGHQTFTPEAAFTPSRQVLALTLFPCHLCLTGVCQTAHLYYNRKRNSRCSSFTCSHLVVWGKVNKGFMFPASVDVLSVLPLPRDRSYQAVSPHSGKGVTCAPIGTGAICRQLTVKQGPSFVLTLSRAHHCFQPCENYRNRLAFVWPI